MDLLSAIILGIIQGIAEFLPISSSGHLALAQNFFGFGETDFTFNILLHLATLSAVLIVFCKDVFPLVPAFFRLCGKWLHGKFGIKYYDEKERMVLFVIIATIPLIPAALLDKYIESLSAMPTVIGAILIFNGIVLFLSDRISAGKITISEMNTRNAIVVGLCQFCALLPGLSRSGSTITGGRLCGFTREFAVKFSFILSIPAILGANILEIPDMIEYGIPSENILPYIAGMAAALVTGILAMKLLTYISKKRNFTVFSIYCIAVGIFSIVFSLVNT